MECLIENLDLLNNPKSFKYKLSEKSVEIKNTINDVKIFEIYNLVKYERHNVKIDKSSEAIDEISTTRKPQFIDDLLFLKVLIEGKANLYYYAEPNFTRFFYKHNTPDVKQLVYKSFLSQDRSKVNKNNYYRQQLLNNLNCEKIKIGKIKNLKYQKADLVDFFVVYNSCVNAKMINYTIENSKKTKSSFNLSIKSGINVSSFYLQGIPSPIRDLNFENRLTLRFGFELEYVMGFNNNKWSLILDPSYISTYKSSLEDTVARETKIDYTTIEVPFGLRHYIFLNKKSKLFINTFVMYDFPMNSKITGQNDFDISSGINYSLGIGYKFKDKISLEFRTYTKRDLLGYFTRVGDFKSSSLILGYTLF